MKKKQKLNSNSIGRETKIGRKTENETDKKEFSRDTLNYL